MLISEYNFNVPHGFKIERINQYSSGEKRGTGSHTVLGYIYFTDSDKVDDPIVNRVYWGDNGTNTKIRPVVEIANPETVSRVLFPMWSHNGDGTQNNLNWYGSVFNGGLCWFNDIDYNAFSYPYIDSHCYVYGKNGSTQSIALPQGYNKNYVYSLDVNMIIDGERHDCGATGFSFDMYFDGKLEGNDASDWCYQHYFGSSFEIRDIKCPTGYVFTGGTTSGQITSNQEVILYFSRSNGLLDLNGWTDGASKGDITGYGTVDVYINGTRVADDVSDFYGANGSFPNGSTYEIKDIKPATGMQYNGVHSGSLTGTIIGNQTVNVVLDFSKKAYNLTFDVNHDGIRQNLYKPTKSSKTVNGINYSYDVVTNVMTFNGTATDHANAQVDRFSFKPAANTSYKVTATLLSGTITGGCIVVESSKSDSCPLSTRTHLDITKTNSKTWTFTSTTASEAAILQTWLYNSDGKQLQCNNAKLQIKLEKLSSETGTATAFSPCMMGKHYGEGYSLMNVTRPGYTFAGWYTAKTDGTKVTSSSKYPAANQTLYAHWTPNTYSVKFNDNGATGGSMADQTFTYDAAQNLTANAFTRKYIVTYNYNYSGTTNTTATATAAFNGWTQSAASTLLNDSTVYCVSGAKANTVIRKYPVLAPFYKGDVYTLEFDADLSGSSGCSFNVFFYGESGYRAIANSVLSGAQTGTFTDGDGRVTITTTGTGKHYKIVYTLGGNADDANTSSKVKKYLLFRVDADVASNVTIKNVSFKKTSGKYADKDSVQNLSCTSGSAVTLKANWTLGTVKLASPTRTGYTFDGWYKEAACTTLIGAAGATYKPTANITLYAKWTADTYKITYDANGATSGTAPADQIKTHDTKLTLSKNTGSLAKTGYTLDGWTTAAGGAKVYSLGGAYTENAGKTLYAHWLPYKIAVIFRNPAQETLTTVTPTYTAANNQTAGTLTWSRTTDGVFTINGSTSVSQAVTGIQLPAATAEGEVYRVTITKIGGSLADGSLVADLSIDGNQRLNGLMQDGQKLTSDRQFTLISTGDTSVNYWAVYKTTNNILPRYINLWVWHPEDNNDVTAQNYQFKITVQKVSGATSKIMTYGTALGTLPAPTRTGYTFKGWFTKTSEGTQVTANTVLSVTNTTKYYAQWTPNTYTVKFDGNGATGGSMADQAFTYDVAQKLTTNAFTRKYTVTYNHNYSGSTNTAAAANATFNGWATSAAGEKVYGDKQSVKNLTEKNGGTVTLYANWTLGTVKLETPTRTGYTFVGWYKEAACTTLIGAADTTYKPTANVTLYAKWTADTYKITYNANGATSGTVPADQTKVHDTVLTLAKNPGSLAKTGYILDGWTTAAGGAKVYSLGSAYTENAGKTLYAHWLPSKIPVIFRDPAQETRMTLTPTYTAVSNQTAGTLTWSRTTDGVFTLNGSTTAAQSITGIQLPASTAAGEVYKVTLTKVGGSLTGGYVIADLSEDGENSLAGLIQNGQSLFTDRQTTSISTGETGANYWTIYKTKNDVLPRCIWLRVYIKDGNNALTAQNYQFKITVQKVSVATGKIMTYGIALGTLPTPTRNGYTFKGWFTTADGSAKVTANTTFASTSITQYYAQWTPNTYTVKFDGNGATGGSMADQAFTYDVAQKLTTNAFTRKYTVTYNHNYSGSTNTAAAANATFNGWATSAAGEKVYGDKQSVKNLTEKNGGTVTLYANWTLGTVKLETPTRTGYTFVGWYKEAACTTLIGAADATYKPTANVTLYAKWTINSAKFDLNYRLDDVNLSNSENRHIGLADIYYGTTLQAKDVADYYADAPYNTTVSIKNIRAKTGYRFAGLASSTDNAAKFSDGIVSIKMPDKAAAIFLAFATNAYTIVYDGNGSDGGLAPEAHSSIYYDNLQSKPDRSTTFKTNANTFTKTGYAFTGWNTKPDGSGTAYAAGAANTSAKQIITDNGADPGNGGTLTLYAQWEKCPEEQMPLLALSAGSAKPGEQVEVRLSAEHNPGIVAALVRLSYDDTKLKLVKVQDSGLLGQGSFTAGKDLTEIPYKALWVNSLADKDFTEDGTLAIFTFEVLPQAEAGTTMITLQYEPSSTFNMNLDTVAFRSENGEVEIETRCAGDVNGDGSVDLRDVVMITRYLAGGWNIKIDNTVADVNADGNVDLKDVTVLRRHLSGGWNVTLK